MRSGGDLEGKGIGLCRCLWYSCNIAGSALTMSGSGPFKVIPSCEAEPFRGVW